MSFFAGLRHEMNESYDSAAESFFRAMESAEDDESQQDYLTRYFNAMANDGRMVEAYRQAPNPTDAFQYLAELYDEGYEGFTSDELQDLVTAHRESAPDDPWGYYYTAMSRSTTSITTPLTDYWCCSPPSAMRTRTTSRTFTTTTILARS